MSGNYSTPENGDVDQTDFETDQYGNHTIGRLVNSDTLTTATSDPETGWSYEVTFSYDYTITRAFDNGNGSSYVLTQSGIYTYTYFASGDSDGWSYTLTVHRTDDYSFDVTEAYAFA